MQSYNIDRLSDNHEKPVIYNNNDQGRAPESAFPPDHAKLEDFAHVCNGLDIMATDGGIKDSAQELLTKPALRVANRIGSEVDWQPGLDGRRCKNNDAPVVVLPHDGPAHSLLYLKNKLDALDWSTGVTKHSQQYKGFLIAAGAAVPINSAIMMVAEKLETVDAPIDPQSVRRQAERAYEYVSGESTSADYHQLLARKKPRPQFDEQALADYVEHLPDISEQYLRGRSPAWAESASEFLSNLYQDGEKVAIFDRMIARRPKWIWSHGADLGRPEGEGVWSLCNPIDGRSHPNPRNGGRLSMRSEESITSFRYAVLECDHEKEIPGVNNLWLKYLANLALPIAAIYTSGGKSIHALVRVDAPNKNAWDSHRDSNLLESIVYGADPAALSAVRLTRLPFSRNLKHGTLQRLLFLDPQPTGRAINER